MPPPEIFDSSVLIPYLVSGACRSEIQVAISAQRFRMSSLVALELYAGTRDADEKRELDYMLGLFARRDWLVTAAHDDHVLAGQLLSRRRRLTGSMNVRDHLVDVLIVLSASQVKGTVVSANVRHMGPWAALARRAGRDVRVRAPLEVLRP